MQDYEKLGVFYLGREYDLQSGARKDALVLYPSSDLVTHAVCVGMTGSGKTGLCICLLEEAAIDGIPAIVIDPKGDVSNLLLMFPELRASDFAPWINPDDARAKGVSPEQFAADQASLWKKGLDDWGESGDRITRLKNQVELAIYTPGSSAGLSVSILKSFAAPSAELIADPEAFRERISTTASSLLGLVGIDAKPLQSREHILVSTLLEASWRAGKNLDLAQLIEQIQTPPVQRIGVFDVDSFFPPNDRFALAMSLNNLLAAPGFDLWMQGEPLDPAKLLYTSQGKPRISIFSIAHLNDAERMFFVSLLFTQILGWIRQQPGTSSLRCLLYMDEIFGYLPPVANPPSKAPLLTLLKQARAFGMGVLLATQNPVDLDYKALSNAGTWFIGRLQTERDKARLLDGLESVSGVAFSREQMEKILSRLTNRIFVLNDSHAPAPTVFETRWALSYLRGPLTRNEIKTLMASKQTAPAETETSSSDRQPKTETSGSLQTSKPAVPPGVPEFYLPAADHAAPPVYHPKIIGIANIYYADAKAGIASQQGLCYLADITSPSIRWEEAESSDFTEKDLEKFPVPGASYSDLPGEAANNKNYQIWTRAFSDWLMRSQTLRLLRSIAFSQNSKPGESEADFRIRLQQSGREQRDQIVQRIRQKYAARVTSLQDRIQRSQQAVERETQQASQQKLQTAISFGSTVLGALFGTRRISVGTIGRATTAMRGVSRSMKESQDVGRAQDTVQSLQEQMQDLENQLKQETDEATANFDAQNEKFENVQIAPKKSNIAVQVVALVWLPR